MSVSLVLDRASDDKLPPYPVSGQVRCSRCGKPVWLAENSYVLMTFGMVEPVCWECAE